MKEEKDFFASVNLIPAVINFEWLKSAFTFYYLLLVQRWFLVVMTIKTFEKSLIRKYSSEIVWGQFQHKIHYKSYHQEANSSGLLEF